MRDQALRYIAKLVSLSLKMLIKIYKIPKRTFLNPPVTYKEVME